MLPYTKGKVYQAQEVHHRLWEGNYYTLGDQLIDSENFMLFNFFHGKNIHLGVWDKLGESSYAVDYLVNDMDGVIPKLPAIHPANANANLWIVPIHPPEFKKAMAYMNLDENPYREMLSNMTIDDDDNPILFIYKLK